MTSAVPAVCPTCGTAIPAGRVRCPGCRRVFGEDNRCPSCNAITPVKWSGGRFLCVACNAPRERLPETIVDGADPALRAAPRGSASGGALAQRAAGAGLRTLGVLALGAGILGAGLAAILVPGAGGLALAALVGLTGVGSAFAALRAGARRSAEAEARHRTDTQLRLVALAERSGGALTATEAARALGATLEDADRALTQMADGTRVTVDVDDQGIVRYVFREVSVARLRAPVDGEPDELELEAKREALRRSER